jgi:hypothetical protein
MEGDGELRIGDRERQEALAALAAHRQAGRLDAFEYEDRRGKAADAVTRRELEALFTDLPEPRPRFAPVAPARAASTAPGRPAAQPATSFGARLGRALVTLSPFIALLVFLRTGEWFVFLFIPIAAGVGRLFRGED